MDFSQVALNQGLTFLAWSTGIVIITIACFLIKLLIDVSKLSKSLNQTTEILNAELKPTLQAVNETLTTVNSLVKRTDKGFDNAKNALTTFVSKTKLLSSSIFGGFLKGFATVLGLLSKK